MLLPPNAACLTMMDNAGAWKANPGMLRISRSSLEEEGRLAWIMQDTENDFFNQG